MGSTGMALVVVAVGSGVGVGVGVAGVGMVLLVDAVSRGGRVHADVFSVQNLAGSKECGDRILAANSVHMAAGAIGVSSGSILSLRGEEFGLWARCQGSVVQHESKVLSILTDALLKTAVLFTEQLVLVGFFFDDSFSSTQTTF